MREIKEIQLGAEVFEITDEKCRNDLATTNERVNNLDTTLNQRITDTTNTLTNKINNDVHQLDVKVENQLFNVGFNMNTKFLFVADSYDDYSGWIDKCGNLLGLRKNVDYWNLGLSGSSFIDGRWLSQVQNWLQEHPSLASEVGHVVCGGGINDATPPYTQTTLAAKMREFSEWVHAYLPNAHIELIWFGFCFDTSPWAGGRDKYQRTLAQEIWSRASEFGMTYLPGAEMVMHDRSLMSDDALHPNAEGGNRIAGCVANALKNGCCNVTNMGLAQITNEGATISGDIRQIIFNNTDNVMFENLSITNNSGVAWQFRDGAWQDIAVCYLPYSNALPEFNTMIPVTLEDNSHVYVYGMVAVIGNILRIAIKEFDPTTGYFKALNVKAIESLNFTISVPGIYE